MERDNSEHMGLPESTGEALSDNKTEEKPQKPKDVMHFWNNSTEFVELPSRGKFYSGPLSSGKVEIVDMTAYHEDILANKTYIMEGVLFDKFIEAICVEHVNPRDLLSSDRTAIMIAARREAYGDKYMAKVKCPVCGSVNDIETVLDEEEGNLVVNGGCLDQDVLELFNADVDFEEKTVSFDLLSGHRVVAKLMTGDIEKQLIDLGQHKKKHNIGTGETTGIDEMLKTVVSIAGEKGTAERQVLIKTMPAKEARYLRSAYKSLTPSIKIQISQQCSNTGCDNMIEREVGLSPEFFWPKQ